MNGKILKGAQMVGADALAQINGYTRRPYSAEEIYTFSVVLCDNEVDRDFECFTQKTLEQLAALFVGKTGILDHEHSSRNQSARIYAAEVRTFPEKRTSRGEVYAQLVAGAYIPRGEETNALIESIESGIRKEVSVSCAVAKRTCSICGQESCGHLRGRMYDGKRCVRILEDATDAYEFSFVAVPAQRAAGVVKQFSRAEKGEIRSVNDILKKLETEESVTISGTEAERLRGELKALEERAACGDRYRASLCAQIAKYSAVAQPALKRGILDAMLKGLTIGELEETAGVLGKMAEAHLPVMPQLAGDRTDTQEKTADDRAFCI
ncbi:MAG: hypothetical protein ACI4GO_05470 [Hominenteromicrobium sp.]